MHILLTNDDGLTAPGILEAYRVLKKAGHIVTACAPDRERSAQSQSVTLRSPIRVFPRKMPDGDLGFASSGTPADCARLGFAALAKEPVDMVISGINNDSNLGFDINYSGTVAAALEAAAAGYPAIACSLERSDNYNWDRAGRILLAVVDSYSSWSIPLGVAININIPKEETQAGQRDWAWTRPHPNPAEDYYQRELLPDGSSNYQRLRGETIFPADPNSDIALFREGRITLSPVMAKGCHEDVLKRLMNN